MKHPAPTRRWLLARGRGRGDAAGGLHDRDAVASGSAVAAAGAPTLASVAPNQGTAGRTVAVTLTGTNFVAGATTVAVAGGGVTVTNVVVGSTTSLTANFVVDAAAADRRAHRDGDDGRRDERRTDLHDHVAGAGRADPDERRAESRHAGHDRGGHADRHQLRRRCDGGRQRRRCDGQHHRGGQQYLADRELRDRRRCRDGGSKRHGDDGRRDKRHANLHDQSPAAPTLTSVAPNQGTQGAAVPVTLTGTNFIAGATVAVSGAGVTATVIAVGSSTSLTAAFVIEAAAATGPRTVTVTTAGGTSGGQTFTITLPPAPTLTSVAPIQGTQGTTVGVTLTGTNFVAGATVAVSGADVTATVTAVDISGTSLTATFVIGAAAAPGPRTVTVTTAGGTSGGQPFTINAAAAQ